jgi:hypothetical protein
MHDDSNAAIYILGFSLLVAGVIGYGVFEAVRSHLRKRETLRMVKEAQRENERLAREAADKIAAEQEAALALQALQLLNAQDPEKLAQEREMEKGMFAKLKTMETKVSTERSQVLQQLNFTPGKQPLRSIVKSTEKRVISLRGSKRQISLHPGSYHVEFSIQGEIVQDPKSFLGVSCPVAQTIWEFSDHHGQVWELISDLGGEFFSHFPLAQALAQMKYKGEVSQSFALLRDDSSRWFTPEYQYWLDARKPIKDGFVGNGLLRALRSGMPANCPEAVVKVWKTPMTLAPKDSWVCHDLGWNGQKGEILVRDFGWASPQKKILPIFYYTLPLSEICPLTWGFSRTAYKGKMYQDLALCLTDRHDAPQPEIVVEES